MKTHEVIPLLLLAAACASAEPQPAQPTVVPATTPVAAAVDPVGTYEFSTVVDGQTITGTLHLEGTPANYKGRIVTSVFPEIPITSATVERNVINLRGSMPDGELSIRMVMSGSDFTGNWALGSDSGEFNGRKLPR